MRNKYISLLQGKLSCFNENLYDFLYHRQSGDRQNHPVVQQTQQNPDEVMGVEIIKNPDGTTKIITKFGNGKTKVDIARSKEELKAILGI